jgi:hypothetical protein
MQMTKLESCVLFCSLCRIFQQAPLIFKLGLLGGNGPDQNSEHSFGYDVRNRIPDLLAAEKSKIESEGGLLNKVAVSD